MYGVKKAKANLELNLARDVKGIEKEKRKTRETMGPLLNEGRDLVTNDIEKAMALNAFFTSKTVLQESQAPETRGKVWSKEDLLLVEDHQV